MIENNKSYRTTEFAKYEFDLLLPLKSCDLRFFNRATFPKFTKFTKSTKETLARNLRHKFSESEEKRTFFGSVIVP